MTTYAVLSLGPFVLAALVGRRWLKAPCGASFTGTLAFGVAWACCSGGF